MKYVVYGSMTVDDTVQYGVVPSDTASETKEEDSELLSEKELKLLLEMGLKMYDINDSLVSVGKDDEIVGTIPDYTEAMNEEIEEQLDAEDAVDWEEDTDDLLEPDEDMELDDTDYTDESDDVEIEEGTDEDSEYQFEYDDTDYEEDLDPLEAAYQSWKKRAITIGAGQVRQLIDEKKIFVPADSTEQKLYSYLTKEQQSYLNEYYVYLGRHVFKLDSGSVEMKLKPKYKNELSQLRKLGGTWHYAGFIDSGYSGTSVCPFCHLPLRETALCAECKEPIYTIERDPDDGTVKSAKRTYNGTCYSGKHHCSVIRDTTVGVRELDRSGETDIICENCGNIVPQSTHYSRFGDPIRFIHIAWDVSKADIDRNFYGQFMTKNVEDLIEQFADQGIIFKFGSGRAADFFAIEKSSSAYKALKENEKVCTDDIKGLEDIYSNNLVQTVTGRFNLLDSMIDKLILYAMKEKLLNDDESLPVQLLQLYKKMRASGMIPPKSMVQYIRDFILGWSTHKFKSEEKGNAYGPEYNRKDECYERLRKVIMAVTNAEAKRLDNLLIASPRRKLDNSFFGAVSVENGIKSYMSVMFAYKIAGLYEYDAIDYREEGGGDSNRDGTGKNASALKSVYSTIRCTLPTDMEYTLPFLQKLVHAYAVFDDLLNFEHYDWGHYNIVKENGVYSFKEGENLISEESIEFAYNERLGEFVNDSMYVYHMRRKFIRSTITEWLNTYEDDLAFLNKAKAEFPAFAVDYCTRRAKELNEAEEIAKKSDPTTPEGVLEYLDKADLSVIPSDYFPLAVLETVRRHGSMSPKQFNHVQQLYERVSGRKYNGSVPESEDKQLPDDIKKIITYATEHPQNPDDFSITVCRTVLRTGRISPRQKYHVDKVVEMYKDLV